MFLSYSSLAFLCLAAAIAWFWQDSLRARDAANAASMQACERMGLQFLDGTSAFSRLRLARVDGRLCLRRTYVFDYTSQSIERRQGFAILVGHEVEYVGFAPEHRAQPDPSSRAELAKADSGKAGKAGRAESSTKAIDIPNNVLDLNEHRIRRLGASDPRSESAFKDEKGERSK